MALSPASICCEFYPPFEYNDSKVLLRIAGGLFQARRVASLKAGLEGAARGGGG